MLVNQLKPKAFENINLSALSVYCKNQKNVWINSNFFKNLFFDKFVAEIKRFLKGKELNYQAILLMDNAPSYPNFSELENKN